MGSGVSGMGTGPGDSNGLAEPDGVGRRFILQLSTSRGY